MNISAKNKSQYLYEFRCINTLSTVLSVHNLSGVSYDTIHPAFNNFDMQNSSVSKSIEGVIKYVA